MMACCMLLLPYYLAAQTRVISGTVKDAQTKEGLPGVTVKVKGTLSGTTTLQQGQFSLQVPENAVLVFSFIGYLSQEIPTANQTTLVVELKSDTKNLEQVVVTALGITRKQRSVGYAAQQLQGSNLTMTKDNNVLGTLAGKVAGVQVTGASGASMGGTQKIKIRGVNSINGTDQALIVVDGTPISNSNFAGYGGPDYGNLAQDINPDDIETITVLKGPAASALYGLRGQYGVVMITTKKGGRKGGKKVNVDFSSAASMEQATRFMPMQNIYGGGSSQNFIQLNGQNFIDGTDESWGPKMDGQDVRMMYSYYPKDPMYGKTTKFVPQPNNIKDYYETGYTFNNNISVSGGDDISSFRVSYNNTSITGIEPNTYLKRNNLTMSGSVNASNKVQLNGSINYANNKGQRPAQGYQQGNATYMRQWFQRSLDMNKLRQYKYDDPSHPFYQWNIPNPDGNGNLTSVTPYDWNNPFFNLYENPNHDSRNRFFGNVGVSYDILPGLKATGTVRGDVYTQNIDTRSAAGGQKIQGYTQGKYEGKEFNYELLVQYNKTFNDFSLNATAGANVMYQNYSYIYGATAGGLLIKNFFNLSNSLDRSTPENYQRKKQVNSQFVNASLGYKDMLFLDASLRSDQSSTLPKNNRNNLYPSVSGSFVFSEIVGWNPLSFAKVRVGYAEAGNDVAAYQTYNTFALGIPYGTLATEYIPNTLNNPGLKPSIGKSFEAGLEARFLNNRVGFDFTYYNQRNLNQILTLNTGGSTGYTQMVTNAGNIKNSGIELSVNGSPVKGKKFSWDVNFNINNNKSEIVKLAPGIPNQVLDQNTYSGQTVYIQAKEGAAFGRLIGNAYLRDTKTGKIMLDASNLPIMNPNQDLGSVIPNFTGGLQNTFRYGNFELGAMLDFQSGGKFFSWTRMLSVKAGLAEETAAMNDRGKNVRDDVASGGGVKVNGISQATGEEVTTYVTAKTYFRTRLGTQIYEEWCYDASYIKMREMRLAYNFAKKQFKGLPFTNLNLAFIARNPFMIYQKAPKGLDPSELSTGSTSISWLETGQLQTTRSFGVNLTISL